MIPAHLLANLTGRRRVPLQTELDQLFSQLVRPRLRPILTEAYKDVSYVLDEDRFAEAEYQDLVRRRFIKSWDALLAGYRVSFLPRNDSVDTTSVRLILKNVDARFTAGYVERDELRYVLCYGSRGSRPTMGEAHHGDAVQRGT